MNVVSTCARRRQRLQALGVRAGDRVVAWLPNGPALVRAWFAINYLGAVFVPLNTAYRGASLEHTINACRARLISRTLR